MDLVIGLMSGTSADGIDAALVRTDGHRLQRIAAESYCYRDSTRESIFLAYKNISSFLTNQEAAQSLSLAIAQDHANAVQELIKKSEPDLKAEKVSLLGFHGQTVLHQPEKGLTVQLGDAKVLAQQTKIDTVHDFRSADLRSGGQGAPLAPIYHQSLMQSADMALPCVFLNIGGVANLTYWSGDALLGFDTGPGNGLVDQYMQQHLNRPYDAEGQLAAKGQINCTLVDEFLTHEYFRQSKPKSLDRADFNDVLHSKRLMQLSAEDAVATLLAMTVQSIKVAIERLRPYPKKLVVCGGGQHNLTLIKQLSSIVNAELAGADAIHIPGDFIEAELMAYLAARRVHELPSTFPSTTGAKIATVAGDIQPALPIS